MFGNTFNVIRTINDPYIGNAEENPRRHALA